MEGIVIAIIVAIAFLALGGWVLYKTLKGPSLPNGDKHSYTFGGNKAIVVISPGVKKQNGKYVVDGNEYNGKKLAVDCAYAMSVTEQAFLEKDIQKADEDEVVFYFQSDEEFEEGNGWWKSWSKNVAAYSKMEKGMFGVKKTPWAVIRSKHIKTVDQKGQPAIHELIHILNNQVSGDYNHAHDDEKLWVKHGSQTVEAISVRNWCDLSSSNKCVK